MNDLNCKLIYSRFESMFHDGRYAMGYDGLECLYKLFKRVPDRRYKKGYRYDLYFATDIAMAMVRLLSTIRRLGM